jgi:PBSX family phage terminase large subunit
MISHTNERESYQHVPLLDKYDKTGRYYKCPICGHGEVRVDNSVYYGRCNACSATLIDYKPAPHQEAFHNSITPYRMLIGGFASGKTTAGVAEDVRHCMTTPYARLLITAPTLQQVREAILPELEKFIPPWFLVDGKAKGNPPVYNFINGAQILVYASDDEQKIRSLNLTAFHIEEASGVKFEIFQQLQTRLRNPAAVVRDEIGREVAWKFMGIISTNPEDTWIKDEFLLKSHKLTGSQSVDTSVYDYLMHPEPVEQYETFISTSFDNVNLPPGTIERISAGRPERWKRKYLYSILDTKDGLVYQDMPKHYVEPFNIPDDWLRLGGFDPGMSDPTAMVLAALDPKSNTIYVYDEYYQTDQPIGYHAKHLGPIIKPYQFLYPIQADPSVKRRSNESGRSYKDYFRSVSGIVLKEANNDLLYGIEKVRNYLYEGKIKIFNHLINFKTESSKYAFAKTNRSDKPIDKDNHLMDALRYMISPLPQNPSHFKGVVTFDDVASRTVSFYKDKGLVRDKSRESRVFVRDWK